MSRNERGRYAPGYCGNPKGRPRKQPPAISSEQVRKDFFEVREMPVTVVENGKRKTIPARIAINQQLTKKAVEGDMRAILEWKKAENKYISEFVDEQLSLLQTYVETIKHCEEAPEEVTEKLLELLREVRALLAPGFRP